MTILAVSILALGSCDKSSKKSSSTSMDGTSGLISNPTNKSGNLSSYSTTNIEYDEAGIGTATITKEEYSSEGSTKKITYPDGTIENYTNDTEKADWVLVTEA
ncbi:MAG: hypothetical protein K6E20_06715 [Acholeplasmatales bacterium]|nr:hypothetical protein [Acholeplasmatales bacterium]